MIFFSLYKIKYILILNILFIDHYVRLSSRQIQNADKLEVLTSSRDLDPRLLVWKGGSVMSKLEILNESWINSREWEELGVRCLREKAFFIW